MIFFQMKIYQDTERLNLQESVLIIAVFVITTEAAKKKSILRTLKI